MSSASYQQASLSNCKYLKKENKTLFIWKTDLLRDYSSYLIKIMKRINKVDKKLKVCT